MRSRGRLSERGKQVMSEKVDREDIQGLLASGYDHLNHASYFFLEVTNASRARTWLASVVDKVTTAKHPGGGKARSCLNIAVTFKGIEALGIPGRLFRDFSEEFTFGMNRPGAARVLGDNDGSDQTHWQFGASESEGDDTERSELGQAEGCAIEREVQRTPIHVLVLLYSENERTLQDVAYAYGLVSSRTNENGLALITKEDAARRPGDLTEPFGFRDGISQPLVLGLMGTKRKPGDVLKTGEFVLGYLDEKGLRSRIPNIDNWQDPAGYLADHPDYPGDRRAFGLNGTYLVFRKLSQNVTLFWNFIRSRAGSDPQMEELLAAKMMGRWRSGAPLVLYPDKPGAEPQNEFLYTPTDPDGLACPIGSHIRRANPRDSLPTWPSRSIDNSNRHRIIRRGRKYGSLSDNVGADESGDCSDQGIYFIALNADLLRQFEFIQFSWLNNPQFNGLDKDKDPIVGDNNANFQFTIQKKSLNHRIIGLPRFVTMKGGGYFFLPGIRALKFLAHYEPTGGYSTQRVGPASGPN
jgi:Dyp-type peroxidase family